MAFPKNRVRELLNRVDIVRVIKKYMPELRQVRGKRQGEWICRCPFHTEKTPSFTVTYNKQFYHCFGCGAHGNAMGFVMEYRGLSFLNAVLELAKMYKHCIPSGKTNMSGKRLRDKAKTKAKIEAKKERLWRQQREAVDAAERKEYERQCATNLAYVEHRQSLGLPINEDDLPF
ncbi:MAG: CHC2 zinc finger domain-containing protein [bacterium]|nr:CHC2 zinc finger domain-containing protein [bacterium]